MNLQICHDFSLRNCKYVYVVVDNFKRLVLWNAVPVLISEHEYMKPFSQQKQQTIEEKSMNVSP